MFVLDGNAKIGEYTFRMVHHIEITKSVDLLADTAIIKLPTKFKIKQNNVLKYTEEAIKIGDVVTITLGYEGKYSGVEFRGYVKKIKPTYPLEIVCEDAFWLLRRKNITKNWDGATSLKEVLEEVVKDTEVVLADNIPDMPLSDFIIQNANGAQVLQRLKQDFRLTSFINDDNQLYCGLTQFTNINESVIYDLNNNIIKNNLEFKTSDERNIKVRYTYLAPDGNTKVVEVGDVDGELRSYTTSVVSDEAQLKEMALAELNQFKYEGLDGTITSFLIPYATRGMKAELINQDHPNQEGNYFIKKVKILFGINGARRIVTVGTKL